MTKITFQFGPHDGDERQVLTIRDEYYRTSHSGDATLYVEQNVYGSLIRYVRGKDLVYKTDNIRLV